MVVVVFAFCFLVLLMFHLTGWQAWCDGLMVAIEAIMEWRGSSNEACKEEERTGGLLLVMNQVNVIARTVLNRISCK